MSNRMSIWKGVTLRSWFVVSALVLAAAPGAARSLFESRITVGGNTLSTSTNTFLDVPDLFDEAAIVRLFPTYNPTVDPFRAALDLRGLPVVLNFQPGSPSQLSFSVPGVIPTVTFNEADLAANLDALESWLKGDFDSATASGSLVTDLLQALVEHSPVDPVAGNPNSLMTRMTNADYQLGSEGPFLHEPGRLAKAPDQTGLGLQYGYARGGSWDVNTYELPIDHRFNLRRLPNLSFLVSLPLTGTQTQGQWSGMGSLGLGFQYRITDLWALTPMARVGAVGSVDVGAAALIYSATLTSHLELPIDRLARCFRGVTLAITNQGGWAQTASGVKIGDLDLDYDLTNGVFRNGGYVRGSFGRDGAWGWKLYGTDARWAGDELYLDASEEIGAALVAIDSVAERDFESFELHVGYLGNFGDYDGIRVGLRGRF